MPRVSIVTPYRNAAAFLPELGRSLQAQTMGDWECLLVDDGSSDASPAIAANLAAADRRFRCLQVPAGHRTVRLPAVPRNLALAHGDSEQVAFLDVDDLWHPRKLERQLCFHVAGDLDLSVTAYGRFGGRKGQLLAIRCPPASQSLQSLMRCNTIPLLTVLCRRSLLSAGFPLCPHEDYLLWLDLWRQRPQLRYGCLPEVLAFYRLHPQNHSRHPLQVSRWTYAVYRRHGLRRSEALRQLLGWGGRQLRQGLREQLPLEASPAAIGSLLACEPLPAPPG